MFLKNLLRRKTRTMLTILGISIGVAAIIGLGALADGLEAGYGSMLQGAKADLVLSQPDSFDISYSSVDESIGAELMNAPEVSEVSSLLQGFTQAENEPFFFVFSYPKDSFILKRFQIIEGVNLYSHQAQKSHGDPILLGSAAAEILNKNVGDSLRLTSSVFRVVGIYQTGDAFEDSGALLDMKKAQDLLGRPRQVNLFYIRLKDPGLKARFITRVERQWPDFSISGVEQFADQQAMQNFMSGYVWAIGGLAIVIGGIGMMNAQLMSVLERTREIGVLRAVGWGRFRILWMILMESISVCIVGGLLGIGLGYILINFISKYTLIVGVNTTNIRPELISQSIVVVFVLGLVGGLYPAWRASRLQPVEALRYEGGSSGAHIHRIPVGGMAIQSLWQRASRTTLTLGVIGLTVGSIIAIESVMLGVSNDMADMIIGTDSEIMLRQADIADTSLSAIDERVGDKIAAMPEVKSASGIMFSAVMLPEQGSFFIILGYSPNEHAIQRFKIIEGEPLTSNHQILLGRSIAESLNKKAGDTIDLSGIRFRIAGIYESKISWEETGGVMTLRDAQSFIGRPRKATMYAVKLNDPDQAGQIVERINREFPEVYATLAGDFISQMPDMKNSNGMINSIAFLAIVIGGVGVLNTMLMSVFERTREIGVLRALGWRRRQVLGMIIREALLLSIIGGISGIVFAIFLVFLLQQVPSIGEILEPKWNIEILLRAILVAVSLGILGGLYPAYRATRLQPIEALRYE